MVLISAGCTIASPGSSVSLSDQRNLPDWKGAPVGNVWFNGGNLTFGAVAQLPAANSSGWIGWVDCSEENHPKKLHLVGGVPIGSRLILRNPSGSQLTIQAGKPIIEAWRFDSDGLHVVVKSRALHGPALIERFGMKDGARNGESPAFGSRLPNWAIGYGE